MRDVYEQTGLQGLQALWKLIEMDGRPFSEFTDAVRRSMTGQGISKAERDRIDGTEPPPSRGRAIERRYLDAVRGDVLPYPPAQGLRLTLDDDEDADARTLGEVAVRVPADVLGLPAAQRAQAIERHRWQQLEEPRRHEWAPGSLPGGDSPLGGLGRLLR